MMRMKVVVQQIAMLKWLCSQRTSKGGLPTNVTHQKHVLVGTSIDSEEEVFVRAVGIVHREDVRYVRTVINQRIVEIQVNVKNVLMKMKTC